MSHVLSRPSLLRRWVRRVQGPANTGPAPRGAWPLLVGALALQAALSAQIPRQWEAQTSPGAAPTERATLLWALGEAELAGYAMSLYVQTFDTQAGQMLRIRTLDQQAIRHWLEQALRTHPHSSYPLLLAARVYASASQPADARALLDWVEQAFREDPQRRWPWLAHAVYVARHDLHDMERAKRYARSLAQHGSDLRGSTQTIPPWARQLEVFLLEANNEKAAARRLLGGLIASGQIRDAAELRFLSERMKDFPDEAPAPSDRRRQSSPPNGR